MTVPKDELELLNNLAHDLKTPLKAIKSYVDMIKESGDMNDDQLHFHDLAHVSIKRIQRIINALIDYSRLERTLALHLKVCDLYRMVETIVRILESAAAEKNITFDIDIPVAESQVFADPILLEHALSNLLSNAIKYNRRGGKVYIKARRAGSDIRIDIRDTGIGIPAAEQEKVWERFYRVEGHQQIREETEGTGLGLSIVKSVVERHGGQIRLTSNEGSGTTFTFNLSRPHGSSHEHDREPKDDIPDWEQEGKEMLNDSDADIRTQD